MGIALLLWQWKNMPFEHLNGLDVLELTDTLGSRKYTSDMWISIWKSYNIQVFNTNLTHNCLLILHN